MTTEPIQDILARLKANLLTMKPIAAVVVEDVKEICDRVAPENVDEPKDSAEVMVYAGKQLYAWAEEVKGGL